MAEVIEIQERTKGARCCLPNGHAVMDMDEAQHIAEDLQILAHPIRIQLLTLLARHGGQVCVCDLESAVPVKQPTVSHHLRLLREAGLIDCERRGLWAYYFVNQEALHMLRTRLGSGLSGLFGAE